MIAPGGVDSASNKRNAEELEQQRHDPAPLGDESHLKKAKTNDEHQAQGPSRVLHVRNLPLDVAESELAALCAPFGQVQNILPLKGKSQAFVQLDTPQAAAALLQYYSGVQATLRGKSIYFQYSNRDSITVQQQVETPKPILLVTITNLLYPVTIEVLYGVFSKYGTVAKIVIFSKTAAFQALIQYVDVNSAVNAKSALDGQNLYVGACTLRVQYSQLPQLNVKYNNDKSRDFLDPNLPQGPPGGQAPQPPQPGYPPAAYGAYPGYAHQGYGDPSAMYHMGGGQPGMHGMGTVLIVSNLNPDRVTPDNLFTLFGNYGDVQRVKVLYNKKDNALVQLSTPEQAQAALVHLNNCPFLGKTINVNMSKHQFVALPRPGIEQESAHLTKDYSNSPFHRFRSPKNVAHICTPGQVLHIAGLPSGYSEESLRHLFNTWRPQKVKFLPKDPKQALVQFETVADAVEALISMHLQQMDGTTIRVSFSKATL